MVTSYLSVIVNLLRQYWIELIGIENKLKILRDKKKIKNTPQITSNDIFRLNVTLLQSSQLWFR